MRKSLKEIGINVEEVEIAGAGFDNLNIVIQTEVLARHFKVRSRTADVNHHPQSLEYYYATHDSVCYTQAESFTNLSYNLMDSKWNSQSISYLKEAIEGLEERHTESCDYNYNEGGHYCACNYSFIMELIRLLKARLTEDK